MNPPAELRGDSPRPGIYWENILGMSVIHVFALLGIAYCLLVVCSPLTLALGALWLVLCALSISAGYHRLFAHRTYRCAAGLRAFYLLFGAASAQGSALRWSADHRVHHAHTDEEEDPYNITKGFWWAHLGWLLVRPPPTDYGREKDLAGDPLVSFQDRHYFALLLVGGLLLPMGIASIWGDPVGGLLIAGFVRLVIQYQATFSINSYAHAFGRRPYATDTSARDSFLAAILTMGEGYHNYHHRFPGDYRNGIRFFHFDPSKWWVWAFSKIGVTWGLKKAPAEAIRKCREAVRSGAASAGGAGPA